MIHVVVDRQLLRPVQRDPRSLECAVAALHFVVLACQDFFLEDPCAPRFFDAGDLENLCRIEVSIRATAHESDTTHCDFVHGY